MKSLRLDMCFLVFLLMVSLSANTQNPFKKELKKISDIKQLSLELDSAWNSHDAVAFSKLFLDDADFQYWDGVLLKDRKEIENYYSTKVFKNTPADMRHKGTLQRIRFIKKDVAIGDGTLVIYRKGAPENEKPALSALFTSIARKKNGKWQIAAVRLMFPSSR
jgi:uncharacterized protein (TIGR02246 family)